MNGIFRIKNKDRIMNHDVIIIGAGLAGMVAAATARAEGADVLLVTRGGIGIGTNSAISNGMFTSPTNTYSLEDFIKDTIAIGKGINNEQMVRLVGCHAYDAISSLRSFGVEIEETPGNFTVQLPRPDVIRGVPLVKNLAAHLRKQDAISLLSNFYVTEILRQENKVFGIKGFEASGKDVTIHAPAVILAAGGGGAMYLQNDNQKSTMGQGYALAAKAGLELWDMEFVQFYPLVLSEPRLPQFMVYPPYPSEAKLINASNEDIAKKHGLKNLNDAIRKMRDSLSATVYSEGLAGPVYMDYRSVPQDRWGVYPVSLLEKLKFDFKKNPFRIAPGVHYFMGGVRIDESGATRVNGLFACGEMVWGLHGANRRGGNALTECVVYGGIAGRSAVSYAKEHNKIKMNAAAEKKADSVEPSSEDLRSLRQEIREIAWNHAGIIRREDSIKEGLAKLSDLMPRLEQVQPKTIQERRLKTDLLSASLISRGILTASRSRQESRGAFIREDFPETDNTNWRKNSCLTYKPQERQFSLSFHPVVEYPTKR
jgi:succinate dehydrogenase/fumarate reductase flavoprotein subunit